MVTPSRPSLAQLENKSEFVARHIGPGEDEIQSMLSLLKLKSLDELIAQTIPAQILSEAKLDIGASVTEATVLAKAKNYASQNQIFKTFIGMGYYGTFTPTVILRNVMENPGWYTAYTPYQAEIAQGRLEALLNFQTAVIDLTGLPVANASLLDEGTAAAEAMHLCHSASKNTAANRIFVASDCHPQTIEVLSRRAEPLGIEVVVTEPEKFIFNEGVFAALVQYPTTFGAVKDYASLVEKAHAAKALVIVASDLLALALLKPPGEFGADVVVGNSQRFGVPLGFGGPHAGFMATRDEHKRIIPGRLIGVSVDAEERPALRLALQTREQHIRREKATSNICTAQVLLAVMASMYAVYHGPKGLLRIAERTNRLAGAFAEGLRRMGLAPRDSSFFDTVTVKVGAANTDGIIAKAAAFKYNLRKIDAETLGLSFDETSGREDVENLWSAFALAAAKPFANGADILDSELATTIPATLMRTSPYLTHPVFNSYHSETEMLRYINRLQAKDLSLAHSMIPLGSCTMKLNATTEMIPVTWPEIGQLHPFAPVAQAKGMLALIHEFEGMLADITGFAAVSVQPNAGSAGEYAGLLAIRDYHKSRGDQNRNICLIPSSAHGTNPASAVMAGMKVVVCKCDDQGNVDVIDLRARAQEHKANLAALMITYPSTHGVFEESFKDLCAIIHENGGQVYMDGANFNALVGLCRPGEFGADVSHLNLHKTFCIPHGGGGPGVGPIGVRAHLKAFLPGHNVASQMGLDTGLRSGITAVASAPFGSASILPISWAYITMMGREGLKKATEVAILNANYIAARLAPHYPILYKGKNGRVAHECIIDLRPLKTASGIEVEDVAKRLIDYGFHAPTMSFPVVGTLMIEPTESESKAELDRFCDAMIKIREEIQAVADGKLDRENNVLKRAPHTLATVTGDKWDRPYSREQAAFPLSWVRERKFWPAVARINNVFGDRNFVCSCPPLEAYAE
jgi:glycine dehydrogenase